MQASWEEVLLATIAREAHLLLRSFDLEQKHWRETKGDDALFANYVVVWACSSVGLIHRAEITDALGWLKDTRQSDGTWSYAKGKKRTQATSRALIALLQGKKISEQETRPGVDYVIACQTDEGGWPDEESDVKSEVSGLGQTLPAIFLLRLFLLNFGPFPALERAINQCKNWLEKQVNELETTALNSQDDLMKYSWAIRALYNADPSISKDRAEQLCLRLLEVLRNRSSFVWTAANHQLLYNVVHSLGLLGCGLNFSDVLLATLWSTQRYQDENPATIRTEQRKVRFLAGVLLAQAHVYNASTGNLPNVAGRIPILETGYTGRTKVEEMQGEMDEPKYALFRGLLFLLQHLNWKARFNLFVGLFIVLGVVFSWMWWYRGKDIRDELAEFEDVKAHFVGKFDVHILNSTGHPVPNATVELVLSPKSNPQRATSQDGIASFNVDFLNDSSRAIEPELLVIVGTKTIRKKLRTPLRQHKTIQIELNAP
jgi:Squalene-hopene cyclase C-terminal domain